MDYRSDSCRVKAENFLMQNRLLTQEEIYSMIGKALASKSKLSIVRLGDGEALTLAQRKVIPIAEVSKYRFLRYAGVSVPDIKGRDALVQSIKLADIVGIPANLMPNFLPLLLETFRVHQIDPQSLTLTNACINYFLYYSGNLKKLLLQESPRVLVIGNKGKRLSKVLEGEGVKVAAVIAPVYGLRDVDRVIRLAQRYSFDMAVVAAGVAAVVICERIANLKGKIAIDIGHVADKIIEAAGL